MPPKWNESPGIVYMRGAGGTEIPVSDILVLDFEIDRDEKMQKAIADFSKPVSLKLSVDLPLPPGELSMFLYGLCTLEQLKQNNWRRLHGLPMKRRLK
ncbi:hypothetical protein [Lacrimispora sp.]|uniref:hypothetical protein n=1 Tax=Lacrimispora sp. TaxID=2719234 RepID=UPI00289C6B15|nr:hypothetical protein [Lacrimispora sp.]